MSESILPRWLKLRDAAAYSAIGLNRLVALADSGRKDWIFDRVSIDQYREKQFRGSDPGDSERIAKELWVRHQMRRAKK
jgi:hypothetical protein